ncbi:hypothetical protein PGTUg99_011372 [Puccinia graminis f. sp. tritici]|uniref:Uncharacterized protein n=1 Tax=Puccinia graminis f. sp. tritici TaxID=56615 RepID=A0A5B0S4L0_PUCGR|nr:hypothetical protein PGTUg99_011372 [Puccinia graminis f. sp. tritici]
MPMLADDLIALFAAQGGLIAPPANWKATSFRSCTCSDEKPHCSSTSGRRDSPTNNCNDWLVTNSDYFGCS